MIILKKTRGNFSEVVDTFIIEFVVMVSQICLSLKHIKSYKLNTYSFLHSNDSINYFKQYRSRYIIENLSKNKQKISSKL